MVSNFLNKSGAVLIRLDTTNRRCSDEGNGDLAPEGENRSAKRWEATAPATWPKKISRSTAPGKAAPKEPRAGEPAWLQSAAANDCSLHVTVS